MFEFLKKRRTILTDEDLELRAAGVLESVIAMMKYSTESMAEQIPELPPLQGETRDNFRFLISYVALFNACWYLHDNVIKEQAVSRRFDLAIHSRFQRVYGVDPRPYIMELCRYVQNKKESAWLEYLGIKAYELLGVDDLSIVTSVPTYFMLWMSEAFYKSVSIAWDSPRESLERARSRQDTLFPEAGSKPPEREEQ